MTTTTLKNITLSTLTVSKRGGTLRRSDIFVDWQPGSMLPGRAGNPKLRFWFTGVPGWLFSAFT